MKIFLIFLFNMQLYSKVGLVGITANQSNISSDIAWLLIIVFMFILFSGIRKVPDLLKGVGKGIKDFKKEMQEDEYRYEVPSNEAKQK